MNDLITARDGVSADNATLTLSFVGRTGGRELVRIVNGDLERDPLRDAIVMSLFTWRRADKDDELPAGASRQGWFGDSGLGSRLWTIRKLSSEAIVDARAFAAEALAWLVDLGVASAIDVRELVSIAIVRMSRGSFRVYSATEATGPRDVTAGPGTTA